MKHLKLVNEFLVASGRPAQLGQAVGIDHSLGSGAMTDFGPLAGGRLARPGGAGDRTGQSRRRRFEHRRQIAENRSGEGYRPTASAWRATFRRSTCGARLESGWSCPANGFSNWLRSQRPYAITTLRPTNNLILRAWSSTRIWSRTVPAVTDTPYSRRGTEEQRRQHRDNGWRPREPHPAEVAHDERRELS